MTFDPTQDEIRNFFGGRKHFDKRKMKPGVVKNIYMTLKLYFRRKSWHAGGPVPDEVLFTERNFRLVNNISFLTAVDLAYRSIAETKSLARTTYSKDCDIKMCLRFLRECARLDIPQEHKGGLFLLYLEICEKVDLL